MTAKFFRVKAKGTGKIVDWSCFKNNELKETNRIDALLTTVIPDIVADIMNLLEEKKVETSLSVIFPNGFTTASFDILLKSENFQILLGRRLVRGYFPLNPLAAEFGANYDVLVSLYGEDEILNEIENNIISTYENTIF